MHGMDSLNRAPLCVLWEQRDPRQSETLLSSSSNDALSPLLPSQAQVRALSQMDRSALSEWLRLQADALIHSGEYNIPQTVQSSHNTIMCNNKNASIPMFVVDSEPLNMNRRDYLERQEAALRSKFQILNGKLDDVNVVFGNSRSRTSPTIQSTMTGEDDKGSRRAALRHSSNRSTEEDQDEYKARLAAARREAYDGRMHLIAKHGNGSTYEEEKNEMAAEKDNFGRNTAREGNGVVDDRVGPKFDPFMTPRSAVGVREAELAQREYLINLDVARREAHEERLRLQIKYGKIKTPSNAPDVDPICSDPGPKEFHEPSISIDTPMLQVETEAVVSNRLTMKERIASKQAEEQKALKALADAREEVFRQRRLLAEKHRRYLKEESSNLNRSGNDGESHRQEVNND